MVILFISNNLCCGGKERQIVEMLAFLANNAANRYALLLRDPGIGILPAVGPNLSVFKPRQALSLWRFICFQRQVINEFQPDIIHSWEGMVTLSANLLKLISGNKVRIIDGSLRYAKRFALFSKMKLINTINGTFSDMVVANSKAGLQACAFRESGKFHVVSNGFDLSRFPAPEPKRKRTAIPKIIMVASFSAAKDFHSLVRAAISLLGSGLIFDILLVGDGPERAGVERSIPDRHKSRFTFTGLLPTQEVLELVGKSDIGILLSKKGHSEGMSNSIMEYMILEKPVICSATGGNPELISDDFNGFLIAHEDTAKLAEKLKILLAEENRRRLMGARSRKIAYERFAIEKVAPKYLELYRSLMEG